MKMILVNNNVDVTEELKEVIEKKLDKLSKYFDDNIEVQVLLSKEGHTEKVEATITGVKHTIFRAESHTQDIYGGIDKVVNKLSSQITKYKGRLNKRHKGLQGMRFDNFVVDVAKEQQTDLIEDNKVKVKNIEMNSMTVEDAIMNMNLIDHDFYLFRDEEDGAFSVVYKRKSGGCGLLKEK